MLCARPAVSGLPSRSATDRSGFCRGNKSAGCYLLPQPCFSVDHMDTKLASPSSPLSDARYRAFLETITQLRTRLHRFCARMTGSVLDGEDVVQETLFEAYRNLDRFDESRPLKPWLFQIAHNRCIDFLRKQAVRAAAEMASAIPDRVQPDRPGTEDLNRAIEHVVTSLPAKERACVLLKDVLDYSLDEVAEVVGSTVGGVKAALHRGRTKLAESPVRVRRPSAESPELKRVMQLYLDRFNRRDWDAVRTLISADARLTVVDAFSGRLIDSPYFSNYERLRRGWQLAAGEVDNETVIIRLDHVAGSWTPSSIIRLAITAERITAIVDYFHCPWIVGASSSVCLHESRDSPAWALQHPC
jgi:RNA polymerase sigma-70 factor (ECF subfamily)